MHETLATIIDEIRRSWRYRWTGLIVACIAVAVAAPVLFMIPETYSASAELSIPSNDDKIPYAVSNAELHLKDDAVIDRVLARAGLAAGESKAAKTRARNDIRNRLSISGTGEPTLTIQYTDSDPVHVRDVVAFLVEDLDRTIRASRTGGQTALLAGQISEKETSLAAAERELSDFRQAHFDVFGEGGIDARLDAAHAASNTAKNNYQSLLAYRESLQQANASGAGSHPAVMPASLLPAAAAPAVDRLNNLFTLLEQLRARYSETYPDVIAARRDVSILVEQYSQDSAPCARSGRSLQAAGPPPGEGSQAGTPLALSEVPITRATVDLTSANIAVCAAKSGLAETENTVARLQAISASAPPISDEMRQRTLKRDRVQNDLKKLYNQRDEAAGQPGEEAPFSVRAAAKLPSAPLSPDRGIWLSAAFAGAIVGGGLLAYLRGLMAGTFLRGAELERAFTIPFYGTVTQIAGFTSRIGQSASALVFAGAAAGLVAICVLIVLANSFAPELRETLLGLAAPIARAIGVLT
jgi:protein tyrosine kinase modulator